jgi:hypothetical protein
MSILPTADSPGQSVSARSWVMMAARRALVFSASKSCPAGNVTRTVSKYPAPTTFCAADPADLSGLWKAQRHSGGLDHVRLLVTRSDEGFRADMLGSSLPIVVSDGKLTFSPAPGAGSFRGTLEKSGAISGHWFFNQSASPVMLSPSGPGHWSGMVTTAPDELTFFLQLKPEGVDAVFAPAELNKLLGQSDYVVVAAPLIPATRPVAV